MARGEHRTGVSPSLTLFLTRPVHRETQSLVVVFTCLHFKTKVTYPSAWRARPVPQWLYRPGGRPPLGPASGCRAGMRAQHCQVFPLSGRVRNPEFSVKPFKIYTSAINLKNVKVSTSPTDHICGPRLARRPRHVTFPQRSPLGPSAQVCAAVPQGRERGARKAGLTRPFALQDFCRQVMSPSEAALKLPVARRLCTRGMV